MSYNPNAWGPRDPLGAPPSHRRERHTGRWVLITLAGIVAVVFVLAAIGASNDPSGGPSVSVGTGDTQSERKDLTGVSLSSPDAIGNQYVRFEITNHSAKSSDYVVEYDVLDSSGNRIDDGTFFERSVEPGETVTGKALVLSSERGAKAKVTDVERTQSLG